MICHLDKWRALMRPFTNSLLREIVLCVLAVIKFTASNISHFFFTYRRIFVAGFTVNWSTALTGIYFVIYTMIRFSLNSKMLEIKYKFWMIRLELYEIYLIVYIIVIFLCYNSKTISSTYLQI